MKMKMKTFVLGMLLAILFSLPWAFLAERFHFGISVTSVVAILIGAFGMGVAIYIDAKRPERPLGE